MNGAATKKKILFIITQSEFGGAQHYVYEVARSLDPAVYDVLVAAGPEGDDETGLLAQLQKINIKTHHLKHLERAIDPFSDLPAFWELRRLIRKEKADVVFLHSTKAGILGSLAAPRYKIQDTRYKILYRIGGWAFNEDLPNWQKKLYLFCEKFTAPRKNLIIVNTNADRTQAVQLGIAPPEKIVTIYNGLDWQSIKFLDRKDARLSLRVLVPSQILQDQDNDWWLSRKIIGTVANLYETKGLGYLVEAAALVRQTYPGALFFIIGEGRQRKELETSIVKCRLKENVILLGAAPSARLYLKAFDVFVLPSVKEGMPWVLLEAMAAGVPIAATAVGGIPEMIDPSPDSTPSTGSGQASSPQASSGPCGPSADSTPSTGSGQASSPQASSGQVDSEPKSGPSLDSTPSTGSGQASSPQASSGPSGLLASPKNYLDLAGAIVYLLQNPEEAQKMADRAKEILETRFSFRQMLQKTEAALNM